MNDIMNEDSEHKDEEFRKNFREVAGLLVWTILGLASIFTTIIILIYGNFYF